MDRNILKIILGKKELFVPLLFTEKQFNTLRKHYSHIKLSNAEKKSLYTSVKKKMEALGSISREQKDREYYINSPNEIIQSRLEEAKNILSTFSKKYDKVFIAGSFLFSREFNDIDIFVARERGYKEMQDGNKHMIFLAEKKLCDPAFQSASLISVSNLIIQRKIRKKKPLLSELMGLYHEAVIEHMGKEKKPESIRKLVFSYNLFCKNKLINGKELRELSDEVSLDCLSMQINELCKKLFSKTYLYVEVHTYIKTLTESINNIKPNDHLIRFKNTYEEMIYGRQRSKTEVA